MTSKIERAGLADKVLSYCLTGLSQIEILRRLAIEHPQAKISAATLSRFLKAHGHELSLAPEQRTAIAEARSELVRSTIDTIQQVKRELEKLFSEARERYELGTDEKTAYAWHRQALETLDRLLVIVGRLQASEKIILETRWGPMEFPQERCANCPMRGRMSLGELRRELGIE